RRVVGQSHLELQPRADRLRVAARQEHPAAADVDRELGDELIDLLVAQPDPERDGHASIGALIVGRHLAARTGRWRPPREVPVSRRPPVPSIARLFWPNCAPRTSSAPAPSPARALPAPCWRRARRPGPCPDARRPFRRPPGRWPEAAFRRGTGR